ncbi:MAG: hypothetical protein ABSG89_11065 [Bacteroidales bacterium]|jgi:hypothetical protein
MVLKLPIRILCATLLFMSFALVFSCDDSDMLIIDCSKCTKDEPSNATIDISLSTQYGNVLVNVYEGNLEDSVLFNSFSYASGSASCEVTPNKKYTITARYAVGNKAYIAVDSVTPGIKYVKDQCDEACYYVYDNSADLRLKYTK